MELVLTLKYVLNNFVNLNYISSTENKLFLSDKQCLLFCSKGLLKD